MKVSIYSRKEIEKAVHDIDLEVLEDYGVTFDTYFTESEELAEFIYDASESADF